MKIIKLNENEVATTTSVADLKKIWKDLYAQSNELYRNWKNAEKDSSGDDVITAKFFEYTDFMKKVDKAYNDYVKAKKAENRFNKDTAGAEAAGLSLEDYKEAEKLKRRIEKLTENIKKAEKELNGFKNELNKCQSRLSEIEAKMTN